MIPYDVDPSLYSNQPGATQLDDGYAPPPHDDTDEPATAGGEADEAGGANQDDDLSLGPKSLF